MTDLDLAIKRIFDANSIKIYPFNQIPNGQLQVGEIKQLYNCVIATYLDEEDLDNGMIKLRSGFYMFMAIHKELDINEDVNPKQEQLSNLCRKIIKQLQATKYNVRIDGKLIAGIYNTTAMETWKSFTLTFEYMPKII